MLKSEGSPARLPTAERDSDTRNLAVAGDVVRLDQVRDIPFPENCNDRRLVTLAEIPDEPDAA